MDIAHKNTFIVIAGPTAVGKTSLAIKLALHFNTKIISADSRQCYKELNIGVAKPSQDELDSVTHHFINSHTVAEEVNAGIFEKYALDKAAEVFKKSPVAIMVGGTGLYIKAFTDGIDYMPEIPATIRAEIIGKYNLSGIEWLQQEVKEKDPLFWEAAEQLNPQRLMRALEVVLATGVSITSFRKGTTISRPFNILKIALELPREQLISNINKRVDLMIDQGLIEEVTQLQPLQNLNALQTVGYQELFNYFKGDCLRQQAINQIKINTRQYAKRQMTWFKKDQNIKWFTQKETVFNEVIEYLNPLLHTTD